MLRLLVLALGSIHERLGALSQSQEDKFMALKESFDALTAEVASLGTKIDVTVALVQSLKDQIAAGSPVTAEQLDTVTATLQGDEAKLPQS